MDLEEQFEEDLTEQFKKVNPKLLLSSYSGLRPASNFKSGRTEQRQKILNHFLIYQNFPISRSMTIFQIQKSKHTGRIEDQLRDSDRYKSLKLKSLDMFARVCCIAGDNVYTDPTPFPLQLIQYCKKEPLLRDELFAQLIKQSTQNPDRRSELIIWKLIYIFLTSFLPSTEMMLILLSHIVTVSSTRGFAGFSTVPEVARNCYIIWKQKMERAVKQQYWSIISIWRLLRPEEPEELKVYLPDHSCIALDVLKSSSVEYIVKKACRAVKIENYKNYLFKVKLKKDRVINIDLLSNRESKTNNPNNRIKNKINTKQIKDPLYNISYEDIYNLEIKEFYHYKKIPLLNFINYYYDIFGKKNVRFYLYNNNSDLDFKRITHSTNSKHNEALKTPKSRKSDIPPSLDENNMNNSEDIMDLLLNKEEDEVKRLKLVEYENTEINKFIESKDGFMLRLLFYQGLEDLSTTDYHYQPDSINNFTNVEIILKYACLLLNLCTRIDLRKLDSIICTYMPYSLFKEDSLKDNIVLEVVEEYEKAMESLNLKKETWQIQRRDSKRELMKFIIEGYKEAVEILVKEGIIGCAKYRGHYYIDKNEDVRLARYLKVYKNGMIFEKLTGEIIEEILFEELQKFECEENKMVIYCKDLVVSIESKSVKEFSKHIGKILEYYD
eukprot:GAHX01000930.1.p1 GENE.GAHX01000930.1~~GAHX01000930.1.p1  ORF type:complete len:665 (-),score=151.63 GAHX01000930.1:1268-3262(-)